MKTAKLPTPVARLQRTFRLQYANTPPATRLIVWTLVVWCFFGAWSLVFGASIDVGSGPEISVPKNPPSDIAHTSPKPNWIDQPQAEADKKSRGCLECHTGSESMHASPNVVLGCTDCHGGNATPGLKQTQAH